jgi:hypothetical protein
MEMLTKILALVIIVAAIQVAASSIMASPYRFGSAAAVVDRADAVERPGMRGEDDARTLDQIDQNWKRTERIIALSIFGVFFIVGMYWWTYGKLHHKLPRY